MTGTQRTVVLAAIGMGLLGLWVLWGSAQPQGLWIPKAGECYLRTDAGTMETIACPTPTGALRSSPQALVSGKQLVWDPYTDPRGVSFRLYQFQGTDCTHPEQFTLVQQDIPVTATTTTAGNLQSGQTYCWLMRTVNSAGQEGGPSNVAGPFQVPVELASPVTHLR